MLSSPAALIMRGAIMLSVDKHCEILTGHIRDRVSAMTDAFKLYVQMFSAIVGGAVVLKLQYKNEVPASFIWLSDALVFLILLTCAVIIIENMRSWYSYRERLSNFAGKSKRGKRKNKKSKLELVVPTPEVRNLMVQFVMLGVMTVACGAFFIFNPL
jgi:hypothetical protein